MTEHSRPPVTGVAAFAILIAYLAWFLVPLLVVDFDSNAQPPIGFDLIFGEGVNEIVIGIVLLALIGLLKAWPAVGLKKPEAGGLKFVWLPFAYTLLIILLAMIMTNSKSVPLGEVFELHELSLLLLISCLVGFNEEVIFRGLKDAETSHSPCIQSL